MPLSGVLILIDWLKPSATALGTPASNGCAKKRPNPPRRTEHLPRESNARGEIVQVLAIRLRPESVHTHEFHDARRSADRVDCGLIESVHAVGPVSYTHLR